MYYIFHKEHKPHLSLTTVGEHYQREAAVSEAKRLATSGGRYVVVFLDRYASCEVFDSAT